MRSDAFWDFFESHREDLGKRSHTFAKMFEYLDAQPDPICIIETGCVRNQENWAGDGQSTVLFDRYAHHRAGCIVHSVDINPESTALASSIAPHVHVHTGDSVEFLRGFASKPPEVNWTDISGFLNSGQAQVFESGPPVGSQKIDLLYLDSFDFFPHVQIESAVHHMNELFAILSAIRPETLVVVDDTIFGNDDIKGWGVYGKGTLVYDFALQHAAKMEFAGYQIGWTHMVHHVQPTLEDIITRARGHVEANEPLASDQLYRLILDITSPPEGGAAGIANGEASAWFGAQCVARRRYSMGAEYYRAALAVHPGATEYRVELVKRALLPIGQVKEALLEAKRAVAISPDFKDAWHVLGGVYHELGDVKKCIETYDKQLEIFPDDHAAIIDRITIALDTEDYSTVKRLANRVLGHTLKPANETPPDLAEFEQRKADAYLCLGLAAYRENEHEKAIDLFDRAIAGNCYNNPKAHWHKSISMHSLGQLKTGWQEHEYRRHVLSEPSMSLPARRFTRPIWEGQPAPARIHVHAEAGAGDNLCLVRYLPLLIERGYTVCYETDPEMVDLMARSFPDVEVIAKAPNWPGSIGLKDFDYHIPVGTLPASFGTDLDTIPGGVPYLILDPEKVALYRNLVPRGAIGICWSAGIREGAWLERYGKNKSMSLSCMLPLIEAHRCVSLQVGPERNDLFEFPSVFDFLPEDPTWDDTAALVSCLDAVVTVDTGVSHLAGALGAKVHLAMHMQGSWHWMADVEGSSFQHASPWYPTVKIHRQKQKGVWEPVIKSIASSL